MYMYIYIYIQTHGSQLQGGDHLSGTTCLTQVFFKRGEYFGE